MSQSDSFIEEVTEEVRRDRLYTLMRRWGWIAIVLVLLIVGGAAWYEYDRSQNRARAEAFGDEILAALEAEDAAGRAAALAAIETDDPARAALLALLYAPEARMADETGAAAEALAEIAQGPSIEGLYEPVAQFRALAIRAPELTAEERREAFSVIAIPGSPLRLLAEEQVALALIEEGRTEDAVEAFRSIAGDAEVTAALRQRANQLMVALGADPAAATN